jgi:hypothetical protein
VTGTDVCGKEHVFEVLLGGGGKTGRGPEFGVVRPLPTTYLGEEHNSGQFGDYGAEVSHFQQVEVP